MTKEEYKQKISPLMLALKKICIENKVPFFFCFLLNPDGTGDKETDCLTSSMVGIDQKDDTLQKFMNVCNGFETVPPRDTIEIEFPTFEA